MRTAHKKRRLSSPTPCYQLASQLIADLAFSQLTRYRGFSAQATLDRLSCVPVMGRQMFGDDTALTQ